MRKVSMKYWNWGRKCETSVQISDDGLGVVDEEARKVFLRGQCHALALAIHELTGWTIKGLGGPYGGDSPDSPAHCVVYCPALKSYVDITGRVSRNYWRNQRNWKVINRRVTPELAKNFRYYMKPDVVTARKFAKTILLGLGVDFHSPVKK
jgi:hypothetical protein